MRSTRGRVRRGALAVALVLGAGSQLGFSCEPECSAPYRSAGGDELPLGGPATGTWPVTGAARPPVVAPLDTDGDGAEDTVEVAEDRRTLTLHRSSGDLVLTVPAPAVIWTDLPDLMPAGDLDGDGRTDLQITVWARPAEDATDRPPGTLHLISGGTPDGTHPVAAVGATPFPGDDLWAVSPVGDVDGDHRDDVVAAFPDTGGEVHVWPGATLSLAPGDADPVPPLLAPAGAFVGAVRLHGREALVIVTRRATEAEPAHELVLWVPEGGLAFTTEGEGPDAVVQPVGLGTGPGLAAIVDDGGDSWLTITLAHRTLRQRWAWDLDDLCAAAPGLADLVT